MSTRLISITLLMAIGQVVLLETVRADPGGQGDFSLYAKENLVAWCVVPFDSQERTPAQRTRMLQELGFSSLAWDGRRKHVDTLEKEISLLREAHIELKAVWFWIDGRPRDELDDLNNQLLAILEKTGTQTEIWVGFAARFFDGLGDEEKIHKGADMIALLHRKAQKIGCTVCVYNHGDWFGEPQNMVTVLRQLNLEDVGLVYNYHHAHSQLADYQANLVLMMPYLRTVNLNGMRVDGPKILPLGSGDREEMMMRQLKEAGFSGRIGILGHVEDADVRDVLTENLAGMKELLRKMGETEALSTY